MSRIWQGVLRQVVYNQTNNCPGIGRCMIDSPCRKYGRLGRTRVDSNWIPPPAKTDPLAVGRFRP